MLGKTNQPLKFVFPDNMRDEEVVVDLISKGHSVAYFDEDMVGVDVIFGPNCHMLTKEMLTQKGILALALKAARKRKKSEKV